MKRTAPLPNMLVLDAPTREASCARREQTSTPLQALVLLNDVQFVEASRVLAERVMGESATDAERVAAAFRWLAGREPDETEARLLEELLVSERTPSRRPWGRPPRWWPPGTPSRAWPTPESRRSRLWSR